MGWWRIDTDTLAGSRFVLSPLAETMAALILLRWDKAEHPGDREWLRAHRPAYLAHLADEPATRALVELAVQPRWLADFMTLPAGDEERPFEEEVAVVRAATRVAARADLGPLPAVLEDADLGGLAADLMTWIWRRIVEPDWPRRRRILEADVVARTRQLTLGGWEAALGRMRTGMRWLGQGRLQINAYDYPPRDVSGQRLVFVPVSMSNGWVSWDGPESRRCAVMYRCSGLLADVGRAVPGALGRLLGAGRARVLVEVGRPKSTSQLVAVTGQGLGSVGRHLKVLLEAGLVGRRRAGRNVLYARTAAGDALVRAASAE
ncbi:MULTISPECIES: helix-turn-helix domain-containing protein [Actinoplanes]|uniref:ArsR/SmtB family transcription factor n=1 Tax=Actinoplanes TaxID=1865 RepID=UPI0005F2F644|nr:MULTISPECIES: helix-turn-helix domain-containing protein [Actinoplanes]GLY01860.1 transcriptional regulator [Actinoplanes sp. NBRC 101535]